VEPGCRRARARRAAPRRHPRPPPCPTSMSRRSRSVRLSYHASSTSTYATQSRWWALQGRTYPPFWKR
jgi:hypothetical protein